MKTIHKPKVMRYSSSIEAVALVDITPQQLEISGNKMAIIKVDSETGE